MSSGSRYLYPGTGTNVNLLGIRDSDKFDEASVAITIERMKTVILENSKEIPGFDRLCQIHKRIFGDVYEWAGTIRDETIGFYYGSDKFGEEYIPYVDVQDVPKRLSKYFETLHDENYLRGISPHRFKERLASRLASLSDIHPFMDGNTRTIAIYMNELAAGAGRNLAWKSVTAGDIAFARLLYRGTQNPSAYDEIVQKLTTRERTRASSPHHDLDRFGFAR